MAPKLPPLRGLIVVRDGDYDRYLPSDADLQRGVIFRKKCPGCLTRFSLLPNDVAPCHTYSLALICSRVRASMQGQADRSRAFYEEQGLSPDDNTRSGESWTERLAAQYKGPSPQLFRHWRLKFPRRAQDWMHRLLLACVFAGCDLKARFAEAVQVFGACPVAMRSLTMAAGLVALMQEENSALDSLKTTVFLMACSSPPKPNLAPSHKIFLAAGRPPPHYGGDLELPQLPAKSRTEIHPHEPVGLGTPRG